MTSSEDPTRPAGRTPADAPSGEDRPAPRPAAPAEPPTPRTPREPSTGEGSASRGGKTAGLWISMILGAIVLVLLLIFVIQNGQTASFEYFAATFELPLGVAMLFAAIAGALVMALVGSVRMIQMSWTIRKLRKLQEQGSRGTR
ncbi:lipopolysaccharide assembly LapA domain-containing protein [Brachybacterium sp. YJGR34]|uniref:LapA family protein n=1 Tax=Brachybacterium sp. YJGR34 TaxID=2059911 RepID=UPI000E0C6564|nr:lipopolysaccharide assembly protein LapA domain-containing protein [Brachybacterium sp. YJGR34]